MCMRERELIAHQHAQCDILQRIQLRGKEAGAYQRHRKHDILEIARTRPAGSNKQAVTRVHARSMLLQIVRLMQYNRSP